MANKIQAVRVVYDVVKNAREAHNPLGDETIKRLLKSTVNDSEYEKNYNRFAKGYAAEDLFMCVYSLLPWVKLITPLGQEQFPELSKREYQVSDYEVMFECGSKQIINKCLIEVKLVSEDKQTLEIKKYQYNVLENYARDKEEKILFAIFWRKKMVWTVIPIDIFVEKSTCYKIDYDTADKNDISAIFGDYSYVFNEKCYRKTLFEVDGPNDSYWYSHKIYGKPTYDGLSTDGEKFEKMMPFETPVLDIAFDFKETSHNTDGKTTELLEELNKIHCNYRLSSLIIAYLYKICCYSKEDMFTEKYYVVNKSFDIIDTVRRKMGGRKYYLIPQIVNETSSYFLKLQFGECDWIMNIYNTNPIEPGYVILVPHDISR